MAAQHTTVVVGDVVGGWRINVAPDGRLTLAPPSMVFVEPIEIAPDDAEALGKNLIGLASMARSRIHRRGQHGPPEKG